MATTSADLPDQLLLDEMFSAAIARRLVDLGIDCRAVVEDPHLRSVGDEFIAEAALTEHRVLVTNNVVDFEVLRRRREVESLSFPNLIYTSDQRFPRNRRFLISIANALVPAAREHRAANHGGTYWLT